jgi:hypothetical protein
MQNSFENLIRLYQKRQKTIINYLIISLVTLFQRSINKTCCSSEDKFITEDTMAKVLQFIQKVCLHINKFVYARSRKCERKIGIVN